MPESSYTRARRQVPKRAAAALALTATLASSGCIFGGKRSQPRVFVPPPVAAKAPQANQPIVPAAPPEIDAGVAPPEIAAGAANLPSPPPPPRPEPSPRPAKAPEAASITPPPAAAPKPVQIFTAEEQRAYSREFDDSMQRVREALDRVTGRSLTPEQRDIVLRIRTFQMQAEQARESDLLTAVNLARRADLLARDLLGRLP